ncbi:ATP-binding protein [Streptomyces ortus]|uniref:ATP-binding protein n=1 Tax=Streptomyces ortus TaxID=2867268 RepID=A0ABT3V9J2_9ACTN|nr:ATP-binding protein [Streptomyces ortus]MCX4236297.1 ATP-binding protein [Streptomyces ortus]
MRRVHLEAAEDHVERLAKEHDPVGAVKELIWNALDADARSVRVSIERSLTEGVEKVIVTDDGTGITPETCEATFDRIGGSWKKGARVSQKLGRPLHGQAGHGRLRAFALGAFIRWTTIADGIDGRQKSIISAHNASRNDFQIGDPQSTGEDTGTVVEAWGRQSSVLNKLLVDRARTQITTEFAPYLAMYPEVVIEFDGERIDPQGAIQKETSYGLEFTHDGQNETAVLRVIEWDMRVDRELHLCDAEGVTVDITEVRIQAPGFDFTAYVLWRGMPDHPNEFLLGEASDGPVALLLSATRQQLRDHFKSRAVERRHEIVDRWKDDGLYPYHEEPQTEAEKVERETFDIVATTVQRHMPKPAKHQRATLALLRESVKHQPSHVNKILDEVFRLSSDDKSELDRLLNRTSLSSIIKASSSVADRLDFLAALSHMVFDAEAKKLVKERTELHKILENETWIFGEHYQLLVSDRSLDQVLNRHLEILGRDEQTPAPVRREDGSVGIVDLMLSRSRKEHDRRQHLVVELKAPRVKVTGKELEQIKSYALAVSEDPQFADVRVEWDFWLVTSEMNKMVRAETRQKEKPRGCAWDLSEGEASIRVWVKTWSDLIEESKGRLQYFREHFDHDPSVEQAMEYLRHVHAQYAPEALVMASREAIDDVDFPDGVTPNGESPNGEEASPADTAPISAEGVQTADNQ